MEPTDNPEAREASPTPSGSGPGAKWKSASSAATPLKPITTAMEEGFDALGRSTRLTTGFSTLQKVCPPRSERLWFIGGAPGTYKTPLVLNLALSMAEQRHRVLVVSLELTTGQLAVNAVVRYSRIPLWDLERAQSHERLLTEEQHAALTAASMKLAQTEMFLRLHGAEEHGRSIDEVIRSACRARFDAVFVDHIGMVGRDEGDELGQLAKAIDRLRALKSGQITKGYTPFVCAVSPLSREGRKDEDDRLPSLGDFRGSSRIDYDADLAMILRRQKRDAADESDAPDAIDAFVVKNRFGRCPVILPFEAEGKFYAVRERRKTEAPPQHWQEGDDE